MVLNESRTRLSHGYLPAISRLSPAIVVEIQHFLVPAISGYLRLSPAIVVEKPNFLVLAISGYLRLSPAISGYLRLSPAISRLSPGYLPTIYRLSRGHLPEIHTFFPLLSSVFLPPQVDLACVADFFCSHQDGGF